jgi:hypothetical protein
MGQHNTGDGIDGQRTRAVSALVCFAIQPVLTGIG